MPILHRCAALMHVLLYGPGWTGKKGGWEEGSESSMCYSNGEPMEPGPCFEPLVAYNEGEIGGAIWRANGQSAAWGEDGKGGMLFTRCEWEKEGEKDEERDGERDGDLRGEKVQEYAWKYGGGTSRIEKPSYSVDLPLLLPSPGGPPSVCPLWLLPLKSATSLSPGDVPRCTQACVLPYEAVGC